MNLSHVQCLAAESDEFGNAVKWGKNSGVDLWLTSVDPEHCSWILRSFTCAKAINWHISVDTTHQNCHFPLIYLQIFFLF